MNVPLFFTESNMLKLTQHCNVRVWWKHGFRFLLLLSCGHLKHLYTGARYFITFLRTFVEGRSSMCLTFHLDRITYAAWEMGKLLELKTVLFIVSSNCSNGRKFSQTLWTEADILCNGNTKLFTTSLSIFYLLLGLLAFL